MKFLSIAKADASRHLPSSSLNLPFGTQIPYSDDEVFFFFFFFFFFGGGGGGGEGGGGGGGIKNFNVPEVRITKFV